MSEMTLTIRFLIDGQLTDADNAVLCNPSGEWGVRRTDLPDDDPARIVVAANTALTRESEGVYSFTFDEPATGLEYQYCAKFMWAGETYYNQATEAGASTSATGNLYELLPNVLAIVPQAPEAFARVAFRDAGERFCRASGAWTVTVEITTVKDQFEYDLGLDSSIHALKIVSIDPSQRISMLMNDKLRLGTASTADGDTLTVIVSVVPLPTCAEYPNWLISQWHAALEQGALAYLYKLPFKPWQDLAAATAAEREFERLCGEANIDATSGRVATPLKYRNPSFT